MRSRNISRVCELALFVSACSSSPSASDAGPIACDFELTGNVYSASSVASCATVSQDADAGGDWIFAIDTKPTGLERIKTTIDLGVAPVTGQLTNDSIASWDVTAIAATSTCVFQAGSDDTPNGTLALQLDSFDAPTKTAHGSLVVTAYLHQPPNTDCGYGDIETITIHF